MKQTPCTPLGKTSASHVAPLIHHNRERYCHTDGQYPLIQLYMSYLILFSEDVLWVIRMCLLVDIFLIDIRRRFL